MYGDQFGEFVCGYWGLKGYQKCQNHIDLVNSKKGKTLVNTFLLKSHH